MNKKIHISLKNYSNAVQEWTKKFGKVYGFTFKIKFLQAENIKKTLNQIKTKIKILRRTFADPSYQ